MSRDPYFNPWPLIKLGVIIGLVASLVLFALDLPALAAGSAVSAPSPAPLAAREPAQEVRSARADDSVEVATADALRALRARVTRLERLVGELEALVARLLPPPVEPEPTGLPRPPPTPEPETEPRPRPEPPPASDLSASWAFELQDGTRHRGAATATGDVLRAQAGPLRLTVVWEDLDRDGAPDADRWTCWIANSQAGRGPIRWKALELRVGDEVALREGRGMMDPRRALARTSLTLEDLRLIPEAWPDAPADLRARALQQVEAAKAEWVGPYRYLLPCVDGGCDQTGPGGRATAAFHGGRRGWARGFSEGRWYLLACLLDAIQRPLHLDEPDGAPWLPGPHGVRYWWDASAYSYAAEWSANTGLPGWGWDRKATGWAPYEAALIDRDPSDFSHSGRWYKATGALAGDLRAATEFAVHVVWSEHERSYSMDRRVPGTADPNSRLYNPLWYFVEQTKLVPRFKSMDRREAHAIELLTELAPFLPAETVELYATGWDALANQVADSITGIVDHTRQGDAAAVGLPGNVTMWFQNGMMISALRRLSELPGVVYAGSVAERLALWWLPTRRAIPPYYATTDSGALSATAAPSKGFGTPQWVWTIDPTRAPAFGVAVQAQAQQGFGEGDLDYYPQSRRGW